MNFGNLILITSLFLSPRAFAKNLFDMSLEELLKVKIESSSYFKERLDESPSTITVFTSTEIEQMGVKTLSELFTHTPSFSVIELGDRKTMTVRGSRSLSQVLLLVDGQRQNSSIVGGPYIFNNDIILSNAKQVEIIRGPGSAMYGANAYYAVINIITDRNKKNINFRYGNYGQKEAGFSYYKKINNLKIGAFSEFYEDVDYKYSNYRESISSGNGTVITERENTNVVDSKKREDIQLSLESGNFSLVLGHNSRTYSGGVNEDGIAFSKEHNKTKISNTSIRLSYLKNEGDSEYDANLTFVESSFNPFGYKGTKNGYSSFSGVELAERRVQFTSKYKKFLSQKHRIVSGLDFRAMKLDKDVNLGNFDSDGNHLGRTERLSPSYLDESQNQIGLFFQAQSKFNPMLNITYGLRFDNDSVSDSALSPRVAVNSKWTDLYSTRLSYGEAFRSPSYVELFQNTSLVKGNKDLKPEKVKSIEASLSRSSKNHHFQATYYISYLFDEVEGFSNNGVVSFRNKDKDRREGVELELQSILTRDLTLRATLSRSLKSKRTAALMPDHLGLGSIGLNYRYKKFNFNLRGTYKRKFKDLNQSDLYIFHTKVSYKIEKDINVFLLANNVTDKEYLNTTFFRSNGQTNRGLMYLVGMKVDL